MQIKNKLFYLFIFLAVVILIAFSFSSVKRSNAIIASVESQKTAISFRKPVQVKAIHISAGQHVTKGQLLLEVERPDLQMDQSKLFNEKQLIIAEKNRLESDYQSKVNLLAIEIRSKIQRLDTEISRLEFDIRLKKSLYTDMVAMTNPDSTQDVSTYENPDLLLRESFKEEKLLLKKYSSSEQTRLKILLNKDFQAIQLKIDLIEQQEEALKMEQDKLKQFAPFDGAIGNVNAQLMELIPPYQTIVTVYEERPSTIKAHLNLNTGFELLVGQQIVVESASRTYSALGEVIEVGARIVAYKDPTKPPTAIQLFGKEIFIKLPENNEFLYGEQVIVYVSTE